MSIFSLRNFWTKKMENLRSKPKEQPTPEQVEALRWNDGPMLVHAGPGSGKTRVLTGRISRILKDNKDHDIHVLALTYTNKAADEMRSRIQKRVSSDISDRAFIGTFHSFCTKILREYGPQIGIEFDFDIISNINDRHELLKIAIEKDCSRLNKKSENMKKSGCIQLINLGDSESTQLTLVMITMTTEYYFPKYIRYMNRH